MSTNKFLMAFLVFSLAAFFGSTLNGANSHEPAVKIWEEQLILPTYGIGEPERNPAFYDGKTYQGTKGVMYPYPLLDKLTDVRKDKAYKAVYLENEYIQISVLPEIGGRIFSALDKTDNYDFFYRQHVINPAFIGVLGAWISGGVEWNVPHHHRASTFMPVDYTLEEKPDGSKTVWVGEIELRHRIKWLVGLTLYPGKSYIEATVRVENRTPFMHTFLYFANVSVHADSNYQVIFPPSLEYATGHGKHLFTTWPISHQIFNGVDYNGVDLSWWKNHPSPVSFFALDSKEDFMGGYNHGKEAGVVHVADHHLVPGKKLWEWGPGDVGQMWDKILTEKDGPYIEIMVGGYSDNQPDYSWIEPYEVKTFKQYWYPLREIGGVKKATLAAAVNLEMTPSQTARMGLNSSSEYKNARVILQTYKDTVFAGPIDISPNKPFVKEVPLPAGVKEEDLKLSLISAENEELVSYRPVKKPVSPMPEAVEPPPPPEKMKTIEDLYFAGSRLEQFYSTAYEPDPYYEEALKRDPGDYRVNTALGVLYLKRGRFAEAEEKLELAVKRITASHTKARDGEAYYYLGVARRFLGKDDLAEEAFFWATWNQAWYSAGFYALAELAIKKGDFLSALEYLDRSLAANGYNSKALNLKAAVLRKMGRFQEAKSLAEKVLESDPLDFLAGNERCLAEMGLGSDTQALSYLGELKVKMRDNTESYLETAVDYGNCGLWDEGIQVLERFVDLKGKESAVNPLVYYQLGYYCCKKGDLERGNLYYRKGWERPPDYVFPFRLESIDVLRNAEKVNPADARAPYYLGNLLFDSQPGEAVKEWEKSRTLDSTFPTVHRNLGLAYDKAGRIQEAIASMEKAIACDKNDPLLYLELDQLYEKGQITPRKRLAFLETNQKTASRRDDLLAREIELYVLDGKYDKAISFLSGHTFHIWEGGGEIHNTYVDAHLLRGEKYLQAGRYPEALKDFQAALEYPINLEVGRPYHGGRSREVCCFIGEAYETMGKQDKARSYYEKSVAGEEVPSAIIYYQGLAFRKLGKEEEAVRMFDGLIRFGREKIEASTRSDFFAKFGIRLSREAQIADAHYLVGLGHLGKGEKEEARREFEEALKLNICHTWAGVQLKKI